MDMDVDMDYLEAEDEMDTDKAEDRGEDMDYLGVEDYGTCASEGAIWSFSGSKYMTPCFDQKNLYSCVSCTLSASLSALYAIENQSIVAPVYSKMEMVDCMPIRDTGTKYLDGYKYVSRWGLHTHDDYPYVNSYDSSCRCPELRGRLKTRFQHYQFLDTFSEALPFLDERPLTAGLIPYQSFEQFNRSHKSVSELLDIYTPNLGEIPLLSNGVPMWHAILVIGYGIRNGEYYCIIKNWRGVDWGVNGYACVRANLLQHWGCSSGISTFISR